jgi:hypothetical protein
MNIYTNIEFNNSGLLSSEIIDRFPNWLKTNDIISYDDPDLCELGLKYLGDSYYKNFLSEYNDFEYTILSVEKLDGCLIIEFSNYLPDEDGWNSNYIYLLTIKI